MNSQQWSKLVQNQILPLPDDFRIRPITPADNERVAEIITSVMTEFGAVGTGFSIEDAEVQAMYEAYNHPDSAFFVIEQYGVVLGCAGIAPLAGSDPGVCELRKMYFLPEIRGKGLGWQLLERCIQAARERDYHLCYLETLAQMPEAQGLYEKAGFKLLTHPMGHTGHFQCNRWYAKDISVAN